MPSDSDNYRARALFPLYARINDERWWLPAEGWESKVAWIDSPTPDQYRPTPSTSTVDMMWRVASVACILATLAPFSQSCSCRMESKQLMFCNADFGKYDTFFLTFDDSFDCCCFTRTLGKTCVVLLVFVKGFQEYSFTESNTLITQKSQHSSQGRKWELGIKLHPRKTTELFLILNSFAPVKGT